MSDIFPYPADDGREDPRSGDLSVVRGGSWLNNPRDLRVSLRYDLSPPDRVDSLGFRCARDVSP